MTSMALPEPNDVSGLLRAVRPAPVQQQSVVAPPEEYFPLVSAALEGDRDAINALLSRLRPLIVRYCRARVGRYSISADDVAQEVCLAVLRALPNYVDQGRPFLAFVYGIAQHKVADAHRAAARIKAEPVDEVPETQATAAGPEQLVLAGELSERMARLMDVLPSKHREILRLRIIMGLSAEETATAVGSTPGAVRVAQHRALSKLRKHPMFRSTFFDFE